MNESTKPQIIGSKEQVAYDLVLLISEAEGTTDQLEKRLSEPRRYFFKLYEQALKIVSGTASSMVGSA